MYHKICNYRKRLALALVLSLCTSSSLYAMENDDNKSQAVKKAKVEFDQSEGTVPHNSITMEKLSDIITHPEARDIRQDIYQYLSPQDLGQLRLVSKASNVGVLEYYMDTDEQDLKNMTWSKKHPPTGSLDNFMLNAAVWHAIKQFGIINLINVKRPEIDFLALNQLILDTTAYIDKVLDKDDFKELRLFIRNNFNELYGIFFNTNNDDLWDLQDSNKNTVSPPSGDMAFKRIKQFLMFPDQILGDTKALWDPTIRTYNVNSNRRFLLSKPITKHSSEEEIAEIVKGWEYMLRHDLSFSPKILSRPLEFQMDNYRRAIEAYEDVSDTKLSETRTVELYEEFFRKFGNQATMYDYIGAGSANNNVENYRRAAEFKMAAIIKFPDETTKDDIEDAVTSGHSEFGSQRVNELWESFYKIRGEKITIGELEAWLDAFEIVDMDDTADKISKLIEEKKKGN